MINKKHIIAEIKRTAESNGGVPLGKDKFFAETGIRTADWFGKYWARWSDALIEAGYEPNKLQGSYDEEWVIEKLVSVIKELGKFPSSGDLRLRKREEKDFPSHNVFHRVGNKATLIGKTIEYCTNKAGFEDVLNICNALRPAADTESFISESSDTNLGYVYMMKSGKYYKIGHTNALGRREYELGIQLPDKVTTVHTIKTDDPAGIEAYWHGRFQDRRKKTVSRIFRTFIRRPESSFPIRLRSL